MAYVKERDYVGGTARGSGGVGSFYHLSFRSASRSGGACAKAAYAYVTRSGEYGDDERDPALYTESDHLPEWTKGDATEYWDAADLYERANGRLYISGDFALPRDLELDDQVSLARRFAQDLTGSENLPYTLAVHAGRDRDGYEHNPHAHLMISERQNDSINRSREQWFRRANSAHPERGGAPKSRTFHGREWMEHARERWARLTNAELEHRGRHERVDHRSYARQGVDREPTEHYGPHGARMAAKGLDHDQFARAVGDVDRRDELKVLAQEEQVLKEIRIIQFPEQPRAAEGETGSAISDRDDDLQPER